MYSKTPQKKICESAHISAVYLCRLHENKKADLGVLYIHNNSHFALTSNEKWI